MEHLLREWGRGVTLLREKTAGGVGCGADSEQEDVSLPRPLGFGVNVGQIPADELAEIVRELKPSHVYLSFGDDVVRDGSWVRFFERRWRGRPRPLTPHHKPIVA